MNIDEKLLEELIRGIIAKELGKGTNSVTIFDKSGVGVAKLSNMVLDKFDTGNPNDQVYLKDIFTLEESPRIGAGLMEMTESTFDWTLTYDEVDYIIEGTLEIEIDGRRVVGNAGDVILIPKNTKIKFSAPKHAKFLYVVYPANWSELV